MAGNRNTVKYVVYDLMKFGHEGPGTPTWAANTYPGSFVNDDGVYVEGGYVIIIHIWILC